MGSAKKPIRLLCLDGGGIRGLSELFVLQHIMDGLNNTRDPADVLEPWQVFDLIAGTSTGGLIAIMLGRLRMSLTECISAYVEFSGLIFAPKQMRWNVLGGATSGSRIDAHFRDLVTKRGINANDPLQEFDPMCKVFVVATRIDNPTPVLLRTYKTPEPHDISLEGLKIWEAARATSAAPLFFEPFMLKESGHVFVDGAIGSNNPIALIYEEARKIWFDRPAVIISIGVGKPPQAPSPFSRGLDSTWKSLSNIHSSTERENIRFQYNLQRPEFQVEYFRFTVDGQQRLGLEEYKEVRRISAAAIKHFDHGAARHDLTRCIEELSEINIECEQYETITSFESEWLLTITANMVLEASIASNTHEAEISTIAKWISPLDAAAELRKVFSKHQEGTGSWFLETNEFRKLQSDEGAIVLCTGFPGAGKTVLASVAITELITSVEPKNVGVMYFFANRLEEQKQQSDAMILANFVTQLISRRRVLPDEITSSYRHHGEGASAPNQEEVWRFLGAIVATYERIVVVIDALDELSRNTNLNLMEQLRKMGNMCHLSVMATSRPVNDILETFRKIFSNSMIMEIRADDSDIEVYLSSLFSKMPNDVMKDANLQEYVKKSLIRAADGMFLWTKLIVDNLVTAKSRREIRAILDSSPRTLSELYSVALARVNDQSKRSRRLATTMLAWLTYAKRPLKRTELEHALAVELNTDYLDEENIVDADILIEVCSGLVVYVPQCDIVTLAHHSVREYLVVNQADLFQSAQDYIAMTCLTYLSFERFSVGPCGSDEALRERLQKNPLLDYAAHFWGEHISKSLEIEETFAALKSKFLESPGLTSSCGQVTLLVKQNLVSSNTGKLSYISGLHLLSYFGLELLTKGLLRRGMNPNAKDSEGETALSWAAKFGKINVIPILVASGAELDSVDRQGRTALAMAAMSGHEDIAQLLLDHGANPIIRDFRNQTPLSLAAASGRERIIEMLLAQGADLNAKDSLGKTPFSTACEEGQTRVMDVLLAHNADINTSDNNGQTPLMMATRRGHAGVVDVLLRHPNLHIEVEDMNGRTAIMWAAIEGPIAILEKLLECKGSDNTLKTKDYLGLTPLAWANSAGRQEIIDLLESRMNDSNKKVNTLDEISGEG